MPLIHNGEGGSIPTVALLRFTCKHTLESFAGIVEMCTNRFTNSANVAAENRRADFTVLPDDG